MDYSRNLMGKWFYVDMSLFTDFKTFFVHFGTNLSFKIMNIILESTLFPV